MAALTGCLPSSHTRPICATCSYHHRAEVQAKATTHYSAAPTCSSSSLPGLQATPLLSPSRRKCFSSLSSSALPLPESPSFKEQDDILLVELEVITSEEQFNGALAEAQGRSKPIIIDWMAAWCRKCIYLKPKLEKLASEFQPDVKFYCVDVNTVPQSLVKRADVTLWKDGEKSDEVIGGHKAWLVIEEVREMLQKHLV